MLCSGMSSEAGGYQPGDVDMAGRTRASKHQDFDYTDGLMNFC